MLISPLGRNPTQIDYTDYRNEGKVKMPFQRTIARPGTCFTIQIEQARSNVPRRHQIRQTGSRTRAPEAVFALA